ncbi:endonuclease VIII Nei2 [Mycolicibacterium sp.]|uniref:endonuclease VIII Nei2 n=1 Tax=Mycolicibacterium sp. TaxID=2320850 RepID=UPI003D0E9945
MPEGDTVFRAATKLREALQGRVLTRCDVRVPRYAAVDLSGQVVDEVLSRGKHLFIRVGAASIHSHLKMDGAWVIGRVRVPAYKIRIVLETANSRASGVDLGVLEVLDRSTDLEAVAHLGPDLLGDWSAAAASTAASNLVADPARPLAEALLDQRVMAGVGNVYANELCFVFGLRPGTAVAELSDPLRVVNRAQQMLWANRLRINRTTTGNTRPGQDVWVYGRAGMPCRRCGTPIATDKGGDRVTYWCPTCQR